MKLPRISSVFPRLVGLLEDGKARSIGEIAKELEVSENCIRGLISNAHDGYISPRIRIADYRLSKYIQIALFKLGDEADAKPIKVFR